MYCDLISEFFGDPGCCAFCCALVLAVTGLHAVVGLDCLKFVS